MARVEGPAVTSREITFLLLGLLGGAPLWLLVGALSVESLVYSGTWWGWVRRR